MRQTLLAGLAALLILPAAIAAAARGQPLDLETIMANPDWIGHAVESPYWSVDGRSLYYQLKRDGSDVRDLYRVDPATGRSEKLDPAAVATGRRPGGLRPRARACRLHPPWRRVRGRSRLGTPGAGHPHQRRRILAAVLRRRSFAAVPPGQRLVRLRPGQRRQRSGRGAEVRRRSAGREAGRTARPPARPVQDPARDQGRTRTPSAPTTRRWRQPIQRARRSRSGSATRSSRSIPSCRRTGAGCWW